MTRQIALRLTDATVEWLDQLVKDGAGSRATIVEKALERERRRARANQDAAILAARGGYPDLDALMHHASGYPVNLD